MFRIESIVKKIFSSLGMEIRWISTKYPNVQGLPIHDPISHNSLKNMNEFYSNPKNIKKYLEPERIAFYHEIIKILYDKEIIFNQKNIADIGCGTGHLLKFLSEKTDVANLVGFEYSDAALKIAEETCPKASFFQFDIYEGNSQKFDVLFCTEVLEHLLFPDKALKNILKMVANNGTLVVTVPNGRLDTFLGHINFWSPESWKVFIETNCGRFFLSDIGLTKNGDNYDILKCKKNEN